MKLRRAIVAVLGILSAASCTGDIKLSTDWTTAATYTVVRVNDRSLLVGIDPVAPKVVPLAYLPDNNGGVGSVALLKNKLQTMIVSGGESGFGASVFAADQSSRRVDYLAYVTAGRFPAAISGKISGVGTGSLLSTYDSSDFRQVSSDPLGMLPVAGDGRCLVGRTIDSPIPAMLIRLGAGRPSPPQVIDPTKAAVDVSCRGTDVLMSLAPTGAILIHGNDNPTPVTLGDAPRALRLLDDGLAAVDVALGQQRAIPSWNSRQGGFAMKCCWNTRHR